MTSTVPRAASVVHIVDDDEDLCASLVFLFKSVGLEAYIYHDSASMLDEADMTEPSVVIVDVRMPGASGFELQEELIRRRYPAPLIFCTAHGDISMSVRAMQQGAVDFIEKPYNPQRMLEVVQSQLRHAEALFADQAAKRRVEERLSTLSPREREVLQRVADGLSSQLIARELGTTVKTVDVHRTRIKTKTDAESLTALIRDLHKYQVEV